MLDLFKSIAIKDIFDITIVSLIVYLIFLAFKRTRSGFIFVGILISGLFYIVFRIFNFQLLTAIFQAFFALIILILVIIFQQELRNLFENIALFRIRKEQIKRTDNENNINEMLTNTLLDLAKNKIGAIVVLKGNENVIRHSHNGILLNGNVSEALIKSIFDKNSIGHDGAVIIEKDKILQFACQLPLSRNTDELKNRGTRHAASLGISEYTDAISIVVSEERGTVSLCRNGNMKIIKNKKELIKKIESFSSEVAPKYNTSFLKDSIVSNLKEKIAALLITIILWVVLIHGENIIYKEFIVPISQIGLSEKYEIESIRPENINLILSAKRRDFYFVRKKDIKVVLKLFDLNEEIKIDNNKYEVMINPSDIRLPDDLSIISIIPKDVTINLK